MGIPIAAAIADLRENKLQALFVLGVIGRASFGGSVEPIMPWDKSWMNLRRFIIMENGELIIDNGSGNSSFSIFHYSLSIRFQKRCPSQPSNSKVTMSRAIKEERDRSLAAFFERFGRDDFGADGAKFVSGPHCADLI